jgi:hypothetical protein
MCSVRSRLLGRIGRGGADICGRELGFILYSSDHSILIYLLHRFVTLFWPKKVKASKLEEIHAKMVMKEAAPRASSDGGVVKKPRASTGTKTNGSTPASGSSARANGKPHR